LDDSPAAGALLLLDGALGGGDRFQARVGDRLAALYGQPVGAVGEPRLGALHCRELLPKVLAAAGIELVLVQVLRVPIARLHAAVGLFGGTQLGERLLDALALAREQSAGAFSIHRRSLPGR